MDCIPSAFSQVSGVSKEDLLAVIGHDGLKKLWPELKPPFCYRGFHLEETILAMDHLGFICATYVPTLTYLPEQLWQNTDHLVKALVVSFDERFDKVVRTNPGVMLGSWPNAELFHAIPCFYGYYKEGNEFKAEYKEYQQPFICQAFIKIIKH